MSAVFIVSGTKVPGNVPENEIISRTKVPSWERMFQGVLGTNIPAFLATKGI